MTTKQVVDGIYTITQQPIRVTFQGETIESVEPLMLDEVDSQRELPWIGPGLIDLQLNGYAGIDFNANTLHTADTEALTRRMIERGMTSFFPTVYTNTVESIEQSFRAIVQVCEESPLFNSCVPGFHLEGPFISPLEGYRGAHPERNVRPPDWDLFQRWQAAAKGKIAILTLSPEWEEAAELTRRCVASGVQVAIGHTAADADQICRVVDAGASMSTHLGNALPQQLPRHPNSLWEQMAEERLPATVIPDGFHLPPAVLRVIMKLKGNKTIAVSDALHIGGLAPGTYDTYFGQVLLTEDGRLCNAANPRYMAGAGKLLDECIEFLLRADLCDLPTAWSMGSDRPAAMMGMAERAALSPGAPADLVVFDHSIDGGIHVRQAYKRGQAFK